VKKSKPFQRHLGPEIIPFRDLAKVFDPLRTLAHVALDEVPRDELWRLMPVLKRAARLDAAATSLSKAVDKKIFRPALPFDLMAMLALTDPDRRRGKNIRKRAYWRLRGLLARYARWLQGRSRRMLGSMNITEDAGVRRPSSWTPGRGTAPCVSEREPRP